MPAKNNLIKESFEVYRTTEDVSFISKEDIEFLKNIALKSKKKRARICIHKDNNSKIHEMIIVLSKDSYIRPHLHLEKTESFHIIEGSVLVVTFDLSGNIIQKNKLSKESFFYYHSMPNIFHTVISLSDISVIHEVTPGPFNIKDTIFADFAPPEEHKKESNRYNKTLLDHQA